MNILQKTFTGIILGTLLASGTTLAADYKVTITNLTKAQAFTPILAVSHARGMKLFEVGKSASLEITAVAEGGDIQPLRSQLDNEALVRDIQSSEGLLMPGHSVTLMLDGNRRFRSFSLIAMLLPTNDGIVALNDFRAPKQVNRPVSTWLYAYDAGTEVNDESCASIPGPLCGGEPFSDADGEGFIHIHPGIKGIGDLDPARYDWNNPVAKVTIERVQ